MHILIIGNGIAGITTALEVRKNSSHSITIISSESPLFFSRPAMMYVFMEFSSLSDITPFPFDFFAKKNIHLIHDKVESISPLTQTIFCEKSNTLSYDILVIASGSTPIKPNWPGVHLHGIHYFYHLHDLTSLLQKKRHIQSAAIIGGGLVGIELAEMFNHLRIPIHFLIKDNGFWKQGLPNLESQIITDFLLKKNIRLLLNTEVSMFQGSPKNNLSKVICTNNNTIQTDFAAIAIGVTPNISFLENSEIHTEKGVLVNEYLETNIKNIYAVGDCAELQNTKPTRKSIESTWYVARTMGESLGKTLSGIPTPYVQNSWYNAAKFFEIEYYQFGFVPIDGNNTYIFGDLRKNKSVRLAFHPFDKTILGLLSLNLNLNQEKCEFWIQEKYAVNDVISLLEPIFKKEKIEIL